MSMKKREYLFEGGHFGQSCDQDAGKEYRKLVKEQLRSRNPTLPEHYWRLHCLRMHRTRVKNIEPTVTDDGPYVPTCPLISVNQFNRNLVNLVRRETDNCILLKKIQTIYMGHGKIDNRLDPLTKNIHDVSQFRQTKVLEQVYQNCCIYRKLQAVKPTINRKQQLAAHAKQLRFQHMHARYPIYGDCRLCAPFEKLAWARAEETPKPIVYLEIEAIDTICGRVFLELRADLCPMTAENFRSLCAGDRGITYLCTDLTQIRPGMFWRGGGDAGLKSIYGEPFPNENSRMKHNQPGIISMTCHGPKTTSTEFQISARAFPPLNGKYVAFGQVIQGMDFLDELAQVCKPTENGKLRIPAKITACGETTATKMEKMPPPKLYKSIKEELLLAKEVKAILQMRRRVKDLKAELDDLNRMPSVISSLGSEDNVNEP